jgi:protease YdgD
MPVSEAKRMSAVSDCSFRGVRAVLYGLVLCLGGTAKVAYAGPAIAPLGDPSSLLHKVSVFGEDRRVPLPQSRRPAGSKLGVLFVARAHSVCTALCVGPDVVATAAHCLYRTSGETPLKLSDFAFRLHGGTATARIAGADDGAAELNVVSGSTRLNVRPPIDATRDWALVRLGQPACKNGSFKLSRRSVTEVMTLADQGRVYNVAYHRDLPKWQPMINEGCAVRRNFQDTDWPTIKRDFSESDQLLLHTCDTGSASSGSPLLVDAPGGPEVVGINVGTYVQSKVIMLNGEVLHRFRSDDVANTGVNSLAFAATLDRFLGAETLVSRRDVRRLQAGSLPKASTQAHATGASASL